MSDLSEYERFIKSKLRADIASGFDCDIPVGPLFDFQAACVKWALKRGRAALFLDTGLGKTLCQTTWAQKVVEHTGGDVLIVAPLCVAQQTVEEAGKFGITVKYCRDDAQVDPGITITNYEMLEHFDLTGFAGVVLDESSILKNHTSKTREQLVQSFRDTPYKLSCTATPSPNDYIELGNQADFLGVMNAQEMLATFFTHDGGDTSKWRLKGHGKVKFWEWMSTWSICIRNPADLGFDGSAYVLPPLRMVEHLVAGGQLMEGQLFHVVAQTLTERREAKRNSMADRIALVKEIVDSKWLSDKLAASAIGGYANVETGVCGAQAGKVPVGRVGACEAAGSVGTEQSGAGGIHEVVRSSETGEVQADAGTAGEGQRGAAKEVCRGRRVSGQDEGNSAPAACGQSNSQEKAASEKVRIDAGMLGKDAGCVRAQVRDLREFGEAAQDVPDDRPLPHIGEGSGNTVLELQHGNREVQGQPGVAGSSDSVPKKEPVIIWCHLNDEQDALEKAFGNDCFSVRGSMSADEKVDSMMGWLRGDRPVMISKPSIMGAGLNFQHCNTMVFAGMNDSFEEFYQAVRRCYRFGQKREVTVHIITAETEGAVKANIERKQQQANTMADQMVAYMRKMTQKQIQGARSNTETYNPTVPMIVPAWINNNVGA